MQAPTANANQERMLPQRYETFCDSNGKCRKRVGRFGRCLLCREVAAYTDLDIYGGGALYRPLLISWILGRQSLVFVLISNGQAFVLKALVRQVWSPPGLLDCDARKGWHSSQMDSIDFSNQNLDWITLASLCSFGTFFIASVRPTSFFIC